eukprot:g17888.t1
MVWMPLQENRPGAFNSTTWESNIFMLISPNAMFCLQRFSCGVTLESYYLVRLSWSHLVVSCMCPVVCKSLSEVPEHLRTKDKAK